MKDCGNISLSCFLNWCKSFKNENISAIFKLLGSKFFHLVPADGFKPSNLGCEVNVLRYHRWPSLVNLKKHSNNSWNFGQPHLSEVRYILPHSTLVSFNKLFLLKNVDPIFLTKSTVTSYVNIFGKQTVLIYFAPYIHSRTWHEMVYINSYCFFNFLLKN